MCVSLRMMSQYNIIDYIHVCNHPREGDNACIEFSLSHIYSKLITIICHNHLNLSFWGFFVYATHTTSPEAPSAMHQAIYRLPCVHTYNYIHTLYDSYVTCAFTHLPYPFQIHPAHACYELKAISIGAVSGINTKNLVAVLLE